MMKHISLSINDEGVQGVDEERKDEDEDEDSLYRDPPEGYVRLRPSCAPFLPPTIFVEYPVELNLKRDDVNFLEPLRHRKLGYKSYWERICVRNAFKRAGFEKSNKFWTSLWSKHQSEAQLSDLECLQKVNHFPSSWCVGRKDRLSRTMNLMKRLHGKEFNYHPESFILPSDKDSLLRQLHIDEKLGGKHQGSEQLWIVKPCASSCGRGISVMNSQQVKQLATKSKKQLVQKYLSNPYLIDGKKFDLRIYVLVSGVDPLRVYVHKEGLTRISTSNYSLKNISNRFAHLTNYSVNKKAMNFKAAQYVATDPTDLNALQSSMEESNLKDSMKCIDDDSETEGFKWSLAAFRNWLSKREGKEKTDETFERIYELCVKTMVAAESEITPSVHRVVSYRTNCFELFGLDVILDSNLNPHLLEVNVSPSLMGSSPLDRKIKGMLIADTLHVVGMYPYDVNLLRKYSTSNLKPSESSSPRSAVVKGSVDSEHSSAIKRETAIASDDIDQFPGLNVGVSNTFNGMTLCNPFGFVNLSKLMSNQDAYRKNPSPSTIDLNALNYEDKDSISLASNACNWWQLVLLIEDEIARSKTSGFKILYPTKSRGSFYSSLFRNPRFTDHLLVRWVELGGTQGKAIQYLPKEVKAYFPNATRAKSASSRRFDESRSASRPPSTASLKYPSRPNSATNHSSNWNNRNVPLSPPSQGENAGSLLRNDDKKADYSHSTSGGILLDMNDSEPERESKDYLFQSPFTFMPVPKTTSQKQNAGISSDAILQPTNSEKLSPKSTTLMHKHQSRFNTPNPLLRFMPQEAFERQTERKIVLESMSQTPARDMDSIKLVDARIDLGDRSPKQAVAVRSEIVAANSVNEKLNSLSLNLRKMRMESHLIMRSDYAPDDVVMKPVTGAHSQDSRRLLKQRNDVMESKVYNMRMKAIKTQSGSLVLQIQDN